MNPAFINKIVIAFNIIFFVFFFICSASSLLTIIIILYFKKFVNSFMKVFLFFLDSFCRSDPFRFSCFGIMFLFWCCMIILFFYYLITHTKNKKQKSHPPPIPGKAKEPAIIPSRTQQISQTPPLFIKKCT